MSPRGRSADARLFAHGDWLELAADYAYQFYGIVGAAEYNSCEKNCDSLRDKVGIKAVDDQTLEVQLTTPQPWFVQQVSHTSFLAVHRATVE